MRRAEQLRTSAADSDTISLRTRLTEQFNELITRPDGIATIQSVMSAHKLAGFSNLSAEQLPIVVRHFDRILSSGNATTVVSAPQTTDDDWA